MKKRIFALIVISILTIISFSSSIIRGGEDYLDWRFWTSLVSFLGFVIMAYFGYCSIKNDMNK